MSTPPELDGPPDGGSPGPRLPVARAGLVLVAFVVVTVLLLGVVHPTSATSSSGSATGTTASTTATTVAPASTGSTVPTHSSGGSTTIPPAHVSVLVANASGVSGAAAAVTALLQPLGWNMETPVNASAHVSASSVYYLAGQQQSATAIATSLHIPTSSVVPYTTAAPISSIGTAEVVVVVGPDLARAAAGTATTATTASTVPRSTTTTTHH